VSVEIQVLAGVVSALAAIVGGYWALAKVIVSQFERRLDERFAAQDEARKEGRKQYEERLRRLEDHGREQERSFLKLLADLPKDYVRREDHIRFETVINAKLDALYSEMRLLAERQSPRG
jgi:hypothetical protein